MTEPLIGDKDREFLVQHLEENARDPVEIVLFTQKTSQMLPRAAQCRFCSETERLVRELAGLSSLIRLTVRDFAEETDRARSFGVDKIPGLVLLGPGGRDHGIRYFGSPVGYEFATFVADLVDVSRGRTDLPDTITTRLASLEKDLHLEVFVNPSCPYCPRAVRTAHQFALESDKVRADMVEALEFPHLVQRHNIMGVPQTVVNGEKETISGAMPPPLFLLFALHITGQLDEKEQKQWQHVQEHLAKTEQQHPQEVQPPPEEA